MTPEQHQQAKKLFLEACELEADARPAFLRRACGNDAELLEEVESLLRHHNTETIIAPPVIPGPIDGAAPTLGDHSPPPSGDENEQRFQSGVMIAGRYRIVSLLGKGGMGEVYRAEDLTLHMPVALKFLPRQFAESPTWLARFHAETRLARQVTHPNVCRVHDVGQAESEVFISMEYIDGETLTSLLKRIGRLPREKAAEVATQLCVGLGAIHRCGVLHRDLKPSNVMIDGQGQVRITDFGIAVLDSASDERRVIAGTPGYMAPEIPMGQSASVQSDLYALGLILYQLATGQSPWEAATLAEFQSDRSTRPASAMFEKADSATEAIIRQCLSPRPEDRPANVYEVAAALPGGDLLAAMLAAGDTPSPKTVADRPVKGLQPSLALAGFAASLVMVILVVILADRTFLVPRLALSKPPAVLEQRCHDILQELTGSAADVLERGCGFMVDAEGLKHLPQAKGDKPTGSELGRAIALYEYRRGELWSKPRGPLELPDPASLSPPPTNLALVRVDPEGRLVSFLSVPDRNASDATARKPVDWERIFTAAGLEFSEFRPATASRRPPVYADALTAWEIGDSANCDRGTRVEGALAQGRVVYFHVVQPWELRSTDTQALPGKSEAESLTMQVKYGLFLAALVGGVALAWRNFRLGRGDRQGAWRLAIFVLCLELLMRMAQRTQAPDLISEVVQATNHLRFAVFSAVVIWMLYLALEPYVRRFWPQAIIAWSKLLMGRFQDPAVGRDLLIGGGSGVGIVLILQISVLLRTAFGAAALPLSPQNAESLGLLVGYHHAIGSILASQWSAVWICFVLFLIMLLLRTVLRIEWLTAMVFIVVATITLTLAFGDVADKAWIAPAIAASGLTFLLMRVGLLAAVMNMFVICLLTNAPLTWNRHAWYWGTAGCHLAVVIALVTVGFYLAARQPGLRPSGITR